MNKWIISDTHFGHKNVIDYCNRPFSSVEEMDKKLIENWNSVVKPDDIVYHLGDFLFIGNKERLTNIVHKLNGKIMLIMGNHDRGSVSYYYSCGFYRVYDKPIIVDDFVILSHKPMHILGNMPYCNIYGHIHDDLNYKTISKSGACVCCERTNYTPINYKELLLKIQQEV